MAVPAVEIITPEAFADEGFIVWGVPTTNVSKCNKEGLCFGNVN